MKSHLFIKIKMHSLTSCTYLLLVLCVICQQVSADEAQSQGMRTVTRIYDEVDQFIILLK